MKKKTVKKATNRTTKKKVFDGAVQQLSAIEAGRARTEITLDPGLVGPERIDLTATSSCKVEFHLPDGGLIEILIEEGAVVGINAPMDLPTTISTRVEDLKFSDE